MDLSAEELDELLGAWALGALAPGDEARVDAVLRSVPEAARRARELQRVVAALDEGLASAPPPELGARVLRAASARPPETVPVAAPVDVLDRQVAALGSLLDGLDAADWVALVEPYGWTVHELVAHLLVIERYTAAVLGLRGAPRVDLDDEPLDVHHLRMGASVIEAERGRPARATAADWRRQATANLGELRQRGAPDRGTQVLFHGWPFSPDGVVIARAFEVWTHADDVRRATGRPLGGPEPADLRTMSSFSMASLPQLLPLVAPDAGADAVRVVLTGPGGGTFDLGPGARRPPGRTVVVVDVVDYCRLVARRIAVEDLQVTVEGEDRLATALLAAASVFAV